MVSITRHNSFTGLATAWERVLPSGRSRGPFLTWQWQDLWWEAFQEEGDDLFLLALAEGQHTVGIAPLLRRHGDLTFACGTDVSDYLDLIAVPGREAEVAEALAAYLVREDWRTLQLDSLSADSTVLRYLAPALSAAGLPVAVSQQEVCPTVDLPGDWETYLASLSKKNRHELRRKLRRLDGAGEVRWLVLMDGDITERDQDDFLALHRLSTPDKAAFMDERMEKFFRGIFARFGNQGLLRLYLLELADRRVAAALSFDSDGELLLYNSGYDPACSALSVGLILKANCLRDAIALGRERFDFLRGNERYKYDLGGVDVPLYGLRVVRRN